MSFFYFTVRAGCVQDVHTNEPDARLELRDGFADEIVIYAAPNQFVATADAVRSGYSLREDSHVAQEFYAGCRGGNQKAA